MVKRDDLKATPEYRDRVSANNKRLVKHYILFCVIFFVLSVIGLVINFVSMKGFILGYIFWWVCFSLGYLFWALLFPYSVNDYFFIDRKIGTDSDGHNIYKVKDYGSNKWVEVAERDLWNKIPLNTTVTMVVKGLTVVDFYKESYDSKPSSVIGVFHKSERKKVGTKEMSYEEFQNYMNNGGENK